MSKTLHKVAVERKKQQRTAKVPLASVGSTTTTPKSKKRSLEDNSNNNTIIPQPNSKKVKLSTSLRPINKVQQSTHNTVGKGKGKGKGGGNNEVLSAVVYLGHIPKGFEEDEIRKFFNQFGVINRMKLFRSKSVSNASKGYAFLEFENPEIAGVVSEAMNGYYLTERQLVCHQIPILALHEGMFLQYKQSRDMKKRIRDLARPHKQPSSSLEESATTTSSNFLDDVAANASLNITDENFEDLLKKHQQYIANKQEKLNEKGIEFIIPVVSKQQLLPSSSASSAADDDNHGQSKKQGSSKKEQSNSMSSAKSEDSKNENQLSVDISKQQLQELSQKKKKKLKKL